jgi:hypothetical protein
MQLNKYLKISSLFLAIISLAGCSLTGTVKPETVYIKQDIPIQERPRPLNLDDVRFYAVTENNIDDFLKSFEDKYGNIVFFAITVPDYEALSLNVAELKRYIEQQKALILYYETNIMSADDTSKQ